VPYLSALEMSIALIIRRYTNVLFTLHLKHVTTLSCETFGTYLSKKRLPILVTERWARSWSRCTGSQPAGDCKSSTRR